MSAAHQELTGVPPAAASRLLLVRHAMPTSTAGPARLIGWTDVPLSHTGREQAECLAARLSSVTAETVYSSPLRRARETAEAIARRAGRLLLFDDDLREIHCGALEGVTTREVEARYPELWERHLRQREDHFRWPGGESYDEFRRRCIAAIARIAGAHVGTVAIVVTHAGLISQALGQLLNLPAARWEPNRPDHASATAVDWYGTTGALISFNCREHLKLSSAG